jgi:hypothetical protein
MSAEQTVPPADGRSQTQGVAGFLAAISLAASAVGIAWHPLRLIPLAIFLALLSAALGGRDQRLPFVTLVFAAVAFVAGMAIAVATSHAIW